MHSADGVMRLETASSVRPASAGSFLPASQSASLAFALSQSSPNSAAESKLRRQMDIYDTASPADKERQRRQAQALRDKQRQRAAAATAVTTVSPPLTPHQPHWSPASAAPATPADEKEQSASFASSAYPRIPVAAFAAAGLSWPVPPLPIPPPASAGVGGGSRAQSSVHAAAHRRTPAAPATVPQPNGSPRQSPRQRAVRALTSNSNGQQSVAPPPFAAAASSALASLPPDANEPDLLAAFYGLRPPSSLRRPHSASTATPTVGAALFSHPPAAAYTSADAAEATNAAATEDATAPMSAHAVAPLSLLPVPVPTAPSGAPMSFEEFQQHVLEQQQRRQQQQPAPAATEDGVSPSASSHFAAVGSGDETGGAWSSTPASPAFVGLSSSSSSSPTLSARSAAPSSSSGGGARQQHRRAPPGEGSIQLLVVHEDDNDNGSDAGTWSVADSPLMQSSQQRHPHTLYNSTASPIMSPSPVFSSVAASPMPSRPATASAQQPQQQSHHSRSASRNSVSNRPQTARSSISVASSSASSSSTPMSAMRASTRPSAAVIQMLSAPPTRLHAAIQSMLLEHAARRAEVARMAQESSAAAAAVPDPGLASALSAATPEGLARQEAARVTLARSAQRQRQQLEQAEAHLARNVARAARDKAEWMQWMHVKKAATRIHRAQQKYQARLVRAAARTPEAQLAAARRAAQMALEEPASVQRARKEAELISRCEENLAAARRRVEFESTLYGAEASDAERQRQQQQQQQQQQQPHWAPSDTEGRHLRQQSSPVHASLQQTRSRQPSAAAPPAGPPDPLLRPVPPLPLLSDVLDDDALSLLPTELQMQLLLDAQAAAQQAHAQWAGFNFAYQPLDFEAPDAAATSAAAQQALLAAAQATAAAAAAAAAPNEEDALSLSATPSSASRPTTAATGRPSTARQLLVRPGSSRSSSRSRPSTARRADPGANGVAATGPSSSSSASAAPIFEFQRHRVQPFVPPPARAIEALDLLPRPASATSSSSSPLSRPKSAASGSPAAVSSHAMTTQHAPTVGPLTARSKETILTLARHALQSQMPLKQSHGKVSGNRGNSSVPNSPVAIMKTGSAGAAPSSTTTAASGGGTADASKPSPFAAAVPRAFSQAINEFERQGEAAAAARRKWGPSSSAGPAATTSAAASASPTTTAKQPVPLHSVAHDGGGDKKQALETTPAGLVRATSSKWSSPTPQHGSIADLAPSGKSSAVASASATTHPFSPANLAAAGLIDADVADPERESALLDVLGVPAWKLKLMREEEEERQQGARGRRRGSGGGIGGGRMKPPKAGPRVFRSDRRALQKSQRNSTLVLLHNEPLSGRKMSAAGGVGIEVAQSWTDGSVPVTPAEGSAPSPKLHALRGKGNGSPLATAVASGAAFGEEQRAVAAAFRAVPHLGRSGVGSGGSNVLNTSAVLAARLQHEHQQQQHASSSLTSSPSSGAVASPSGITSVDSGSGSGSGSGQAPFKTRRPANMLGTSAAAENRSPRASPRLRPTASPQ